MTVSDFYTPNFFDPDVASGVRYSYTGAIKAPREVLQDGYLSWHHPPSDHWWQLQRFGAGKKFEDLGVFEKGAESIRAQIDRTTSGKQLQAMGGKRKRSVLTGMSRAATTEEATDAKAVAWKSQIRALIKP